MSLGKKITCNKCNTKLFSFNKLQLECPVCHHWLDVNELKKNNYYDNTNDDDIEEELIDQGDLDNLSDEDLLNKVIPTNYYDQENLDNLIQDISREDIEDKYDDFSEH